MNIEVVVHNKGSITVSGKTKLTPKKLNKFVKRSVKLIHNANLEAGLRELVDMEAADD